VVATAEIYAREDSVLREGCGLVDRSERGKLALTGSEAKEFLQGQVTNDVEALSEGEGCYAAFLDHKGKMQGDLRVLDFGHELWLDCQTEHACAGGKLGGAPVARVVTDLGVDVICVAEDVARVRAALEADGAVPVSEAAAEVLRVESGRPRYGLDLDQTVIPQEAGLNDRAVSFTKGCYVGQETVARLHYRGKPNRHLRGLRLSEPAPSGAELRLGEKVVGRLGSVVLSPRLGPIALALVRREASPGDRLAVDGSAAGAEVVELPF
jgi:folate-binding protein YgfZ